MRAAVYRGAGEIKVETRDVPRPGPGDVLLEVSHCGVCGTDLHLTMEGWGVPDSIGGHEYSGRVIAVGSGVAGWSVGDAAVGGAASGCGACEYCLAHRPSLCATGAFSGMGSGFSGAFAEYKAVSADQLVRVPEGLSLRDAALVEPLAVALHGLTRSGVAPGARVLITGAGPIGMLTLASLIARGIDDVTVSEPGKVRRELAERIGARSVVAPESLDLPKMPFQLVDAPFDVSFECSGNPRAFRAALAQLKRGGTLVILGTGMERPQLDPNRVLLNELVVTGAYNYDESGFDDALALLASGNLPTQDLIHPRDVGLDGLFSAMEALVAGRIGGKVLVAPGAGEEKK